MGVNQKLITLALNLNASTNYILNHVDRLVRVCLHVIGLSCSVLVVHCVVICCFSLIVVVVLVWVLVAYLVLVQVIYV